MSKKLTKEVLEQMVLQVMNESNIEEGWVQDFTSMFGRGRTMTPSEKRPLGTKTKFGGSQSDMEQLLNMIQLDPKVPNYIRDFATDIIAKPRVSTANLEQLPTANISAVDDEGNVITTAKETEMTGLPSSGGMPDKVSAPGSVGRFDKKQIPELPAKRVRSTAAYSNVAESKIEALVMEAMEEMIQSYVGSAGERRTTPFTSKNRNTGSKNTAVLPTVKEIPTAKYAADEKPTVKSLSNRDRKPSQEYYKRVGGKHPDAVAESKLESLVADVLAEMSKKKPVKETKKPVKK